MVDDGSCKTFILGSTLASFSVSHGKLEPAFNPHVYTYKVTEMAGTELGLSVVLTTAPYTL